MDINSIMTDQILEIRFHGRGGQGAKTAAQLIAETALRQGKQVQAFPEYGPERMGAPVKAYVRISDKSIKSYASVTNPDIVVVIDPTLIKTVDVTEGLGEKGILIINSGKAPDDIRKDLNSFKGMISTIDGTSLSMKYLGRNIPNTPLLGALVKVTGIVELAELKKRVEEHFLSKLGREKTQANIKMIEEAYRKS